MKRLSRAVVALAACSLALALAAPVWAQDSGDGMVQGWAILAEKDDYDDVEMTNLPVDYIGVTQVRQVLVDSGWDADHVRELRDFDRAALQEGLDWLADSADVDDLVFLYVTAHGHYLRDVLAWEDFFAAAWAQIPSQRRLLLIDSCQAASYTGAVVDDPSPHLAVAAVAGDELSWSGLEEEGLPIIGGVFTHYFAAAFGEPDADTDGDGLISVQEAVALAEAQQRAYMHDVVFAVPEFLESYHDIGFFPDQDPDYPHVVVDDTLGEPLYLALEAYAPTLPAQDMLTTEAELSGSAGPIYSLAWSPDGRALASAGYRQVTLWDTETHEELVTLEGHTGYVWGLAWSPDGRMLATASQDGTVRLWDAERHDELAVLDSGWAFSVAWSPDGDQLVSGTFDGRAQVWDVETGTLLREMPGTSMLISIAWSPDGRFIAAGQWDGRLRLWDAATGDLLHTFVGTQARSDVNGLAWSPDGSLLAAAQQDGAIRLWDVADGAVARTLEAHTGWARGVAWSPDGRWLASTGEDAAARVWDVETGEQRVRLRSDPLPIWSVAWSPDGTRLAAGSGVYNRRSPGGTVLLWDLSLPGD